MRQWFNTITNIVDADIKSAAAIDASKIADVSVSNAEFQRLDGVTSDIQTQLDGKQASVLHNSNSSVTISDGNINSDNNTIEHCSADMTTITNRFSCRCMTLKHLLLLMLLKLLMVQ